MLTLMAAGCAAPLGPDQAEAISILRFGNPGHSMATFSGYDQPQLFAVHDSETLAFVWQQIYGGPVCSPGNGCVGSLPPFVDFAHNTVVVVAFGSQPTTGYEILLDTAILDSNGLTVFFHRIGPDPSSVQAQVVTQPVDAGVIPRFAGPIIFHDLTP